MPIPIETDPVTARESTDLRNEIRSPTVTLRDQMRALDTSVRAQANRLDDNYRALERSMREFTQTTHADNERTRDKVDTTLRWLITSSIIFGFGLIGTLIQVVRLPH